MNERVSSGEREVAKWEPFTGSPRDKKDVGWLGGFASPEEGTGAVLRRGDEPLGIIQYHTQTLTDGTSALCVNDLHIDESVRGNPGFLNKLITLLQQEAGARGVESVSWVVSSDSEEMSGISKKLEDAKVTKTMGDLHKIPLQNLDMQVIFELLKKQRKSSV